MNWPTHTDYQDAIQNPAICFAEEDLKAGTAACDMLGLPRVMSGNFASVYELNSGGQRYAVRCFVRQVMGQQGRYARLCEHLGKIAMPWLVDFSYFLKGILVRGEWYPIVKMQWVEGLPINNWVEENLNSPDKLRAVAAQWRTLMADMRKHHLAHGDYQHGNIMITPQDELRLVDYDGMYCPAFGKGRSPELGHANFQHPRRLPEHYDDSLDNFSSLVIYMSLLALAEDPGLWKEFYTGDNLLLTSGDYKNPQNSKAFARLRESKNTVVKQLAALVQDCAMRSISDVPWFEDAVVGAEQGTLEAKLKSMPEPAAAAASWLDDAAAAAASEGSRPASRPAPMMSRPAPAPTPAPVMSRASPAPAMQPAASLGSTQPKPRTTPSPAPSTAPKPAPKTTPPFQPAASADGKSSSGLMLIAGVVVIIILIVLIFATRKAPAPNLVEPATPAAH